MGRFVVIFFFFTLAGCAAFSKAKEKNLYQVHEGMSKTELIALLDKPSKEMISGPTQKLYYDIYSDDSGRVYPYTAKFENGALTQWYFDTSRNEADAHSKPRSGKDRSAAGH